MSLFKTKGIQHPETYSYASKWNTQFGHSI